MQLLFAFEQIIINTEEEQDQEQLQEHTQEDMEDPYFRDQIAQLYNPLYNGMTDA